MFSRSVKRGAAALGKLAAPVCRRDSEIALLRRHELLKSSTPIDYQG
jgi:hypothetical protein